VAAPLHRSVASRSRPLGHARAYDGRPAVVAADPGGNARRLPYTRDPMRTIPRIRTTVRRAAATARLSGVARAVRRQNLTYLSPDKLRTIERCLDSLLRERVPGDFVEAGVALGGSAIMIADHLDDGRRFHGYDVFGLIPAPGDADPPEVHERYDVIASGHSDGIGDDVYYGYRDDLYADVVAAFSSFGLLVDGDRVQLHRGLFEATLRPDAPIAFAHIDCDWHDPVALCLERIHPHLSPGAWLVIDDYYAYGGARTAVDAFLAAHPDLTATPAGGNEHLVVRRRTEGA
jgi:O-methyltransferase